MITVNPLSSNITPNTAAARWHLGAALAAANEPLNGLEIEFRLKNPERWFARQRQRRQERRDR